MSALPARLATAFALFITLASEARADEPKRDPAAAEVLFRAGFQALDRGDWATACAKFDASMKLDPSASTLLNLARCHTHDGKVALAWSECQRALVLNRDTAGDARRAELDKAARKMAADLEPRMGRLRIVVRPSSAAPKVSRDGVEVPAAALDEPIPVDPGAHELAAAADGYAPGKVTATVREGETRDVVLELTPSPPSTGPARTTPVPPPPRDTPAARSSTPTWAWVVGGTGVALTAASVAFLVDERSAQGQIDAKCTLPGKHCGAFDPTELNARTQRDFGLFVGLGAAGLVSIGIGAVGVLRGSKPPSDAAPSIAVTGDRILFRGVF